LNHPVTPKAGVKPKNNELLPDIIAENCHRSSILIRFPFVNTAFFSTENKLLKNKFRNLAFTGHNCYTLNNISVLFDLRFATIMKIILNSKQIDKILNTLTSRILSEIPAGINIAVIGIRSRGEVLAQRLSSRLSKKLNKKIPCGTLDITLYRDDLNSPQGDAQPQVRTTEIGFDIDNKIIILVDDVLYTGRSARAAMDALIDLGRPRAIRLAVLVDRAGREFPIQADYAGYKADAAPGKLVQVLLAESDGKEEVVIE
jgi:pyrimidine operon attenuation protein/uracil phosphoribosyltransferase